MIENRTIATRWLSRALPLCLATPLAAQAPLFREASHDYGLAVEHLAGNDTYGMSGGVGWIDVDLDGDDDLILTGGGVLQQALRNDNDSFTDLSTTANLVTPERNTMGIIGADYDQDGLPDLYLTAFGANDLFRNLGGFQFEDVSMTEEVAGNRWSSSAAWADFDLDGDLDLYVGNYLEVLSFPYHIGSANELYINQDGAGPQPFVEMAALLGVDDSGVFGPLRDPTFEQQYGPPPIGLATAGCTLSVATVDYDEDGKPDLQVGNDFGWFVLRDKLYRNDTVSGSGLAFTDVTVATMYDQIPLCNMGINAADYDHDGDWDFYHSNLGINVLLRNDGGVFNDVAASAGPMEGEHTNGQLLSSWGSAWVDFDHDGWEDLFVVNGWVPAASFIQNAVHSPDALWKNAGNGTFSRYSAGDSGLDGIGVGRGMAVSDVDGDGRMDIFVVHNTAFFPANAERLSRLYINEGEGGNWLKLRLRGRKSNREGIGARIEARSGEELWKRQVLADPVYLSSATRTVHFGLGRHPAVDLEIAWPSGVEQRIPNLSVNADLVVQEPLVLVNRIMTAARTAGGLKVVAVVENDTNAPRQATLAVRLLRSATPDVLHKALRNIRLDPGERRSEHWSFPPIPGGTGPVDLAVYALCSGGLDGEALTLTLP